jgi:hypothetical protein
VACVQPAEEVVEVQPQAVVGRERVLRRHDQDPHARQHARPATPNFAERATCSRVVIFKVAGAAA